MSDMPWKMPDPAKTTKAKAAQIDAVTKYLEDKVERHNRPLPSANELLALYPAGWKYGGTFPDSGGRQGYRITIRQVARVIHIHVKDNKIDRAHIIRKLIESDERGKEKLAAMAGENPELTEGQLAKFGDKYAQTRLKENLNTLSEALQPLHDEAAAGNRYEKVIFEPSDNINRFKYSGKDTGIQLLKCMRDLINANAGAGTISGATGFQL